MGTELPLREAVDRSTAGRLPVHHQVRRREPGRGAAPISTDDERRQVAEAVTRADTQADDRARRKEGTPPDGGIDVGICDIMARSVAATVRSGPQLYWYIA